MTVLKKNNCRIIHLTDGNLIGEAINSINKGNADGINFNFIKNFPKEINDIKFANNIKYIQINDYGNFQEFDYSAIEYLSKLNHLSVYTSDKKEINFLNFPELKSASIFWRPKAKSLFNCSHLESLFIGKYTESDLSKFDKLVNLNYLRINTGSLKTLNGIEGLKELETLLLTQVTKLNDITAIKKLHKLKELKVDNCKNIKNIDSINNLPHIEKLQISGTTPKFKSQ